MNQTTTAKIILCPKCKGHKHLKILDRRGPMVNLTEKPCQYCNAEGMVCETVTTIIKHEPYINIKPFEV